MPDRAAPLRRCSTHGGTLCQEGVRNWPGDLLRPSGWDCIAGFPRRCPGFVPSRGPGVKRQRGQPFPARPAPGTRPAGRDRGRPARSGVRLRSRVRSRTSWTRRRELRLRQQVRAQQLRQDLGAGLVVLQPRGGDRLAPRRMHQMRARSRSPPSSPASHPVPNAASNAVGVPGGSPPITCLAPRSRTVPP